MGYIGIMYGLYRGNGKETGHYYLAFRVGLGFRGLSASEIDVGFEGLFKGLHEEIWRYLGYIGICREKGFKAQGFAVPSPNSKGVTYGSLPY